MFNENGRALTEMLRDSDDDEDLCLIGCGLPTTEHSNCHDCVSELRRIVEVQAELIENLQTKRRNAMLSERRSFSSPELGGEIRSYFVDLKSSFEVFENKLDFISEKIIWLADRLKRDRRCRGYCTKHVRTKKCLCRGFEDPHRCCGRHGGICDC